MRRVARCDRCGDRPRGEGNVPWCAACLAALREAPTAEGRREYKLAYCRAYARARRGPATLRWTTSEGLAVTLRPRLGRVTICGACRRADDGRRLVSDVLGLKVEEETFSGGGKGRRRQKRFRLVALVAACDELARLLDGVATRDAASRSVAKRPRAGSSGRS